MPCWPAPKSRPAIVTWSHQHYQECHQGLCIMYFNDINYTNHFFRFQSTFSHIFEAKPNPLAKNQYVSPRINDTSINMEKTGYTAYENYASPSPRLLSRTLSNKAKTREAYKRSSSSENSQHWEGRPSFPTHFGRLERSETRNYES